MSAVCLFAVLFCLLLFCQRQSFHLFTVLLVSVVLSFHCVVLSLLFFTVAHCVVWAFNELSVHCVVSVSAPLVHCLVSVSFIFLFDCFVV